MFEAEARIAWFLSLQRLLRFPKYFMAPRAYSRPGQGPVASDLATTGRGVASSQVEWTTPPRPDSFLAPSLPSLDQAISPVDRLGAAMVRGFGREATSQSTGNSSLRQAAPNSVFIAKSRAVFAAPIRGKTVSIYASSTPPNRSRLAVGATAPELQSAKAVPLAPINVLSLLRHSANFARHLDPILTVSGSDDIALEGKHFSHGELPALKKNFANQDRALLSNRDGTAKGGRPQQGGQAVSILHIDGSALGRWTLQHLERTLGKPTTGMTGVDPRATIPRSRVAPF